MDILRTTLTFGALVALAVPGAAADPLDLDAGCTFRSHSGTGANTVLLTLAGVATAPGAMVTYLRCELLDADGAPVLDFEVALVGGAAALADAAEVPNPGELTVCVTAFTVYTSGAIEEMPRTCTTP